MEKKICIFCSSSKYIDELYGNAADILTEIMVKNNFELVWGGADIGLMGDLARSIQKHGGIARGVLPKSLLKINLEYRDADELIITRDMSMRKNVMNDMSDAFICMPGGFGTLEEILEIITLKQLGYIDKPVVFYNINNYYDLFMKFIEQMIDDKFIKSAGKELYYVSDNPKEIIEYIKNYSGSTHLDKW